METKKYLFIFEEGVELIEAKSIKQAVIMLVNDYDVGNTLFYKSVNGFEDNDPDLFELVSLNFCKDIESVFIVDKQIYSQYR